MTGTPQKLFAKWTQSFDYGVRALTKMYCADGSMVLPLYEKPSR